MYLNISVFRQFILTWTKFYFNFTFHRKTDKYLYYCDEHPEEAINGSIVSDRLSFSRQLGSVATVLLTYVFKYNSKIVKTSLFGASLGRSAIPDALLQFILLIKNKSIISSYSQFYEYT